MKKVMVVFGTRPEAIKVIPVIKELNTRKNIITKILVTAQHRDMLDQVLNDFDIHPDYDLDIMKESQSLSYITSKILEGLDEVIEIEKPDVILVHGDTTTALAAAMAGFYHKVKVGHIEAGLRTYNKYFPFPEEINRQFVGLVSEYNFAPTELAKKNLLEEKKPKDNIFVTGNTVVDMLKYTVREDYSSPITSWAGEDKLILLTCHRREVIGKTMEGIFRAVKNIVKHRNDVKVVFPVHKNPKVREIAKKVFSGEDRIKLIEPLDVIDFHNIMKRSFLILSDSGGIQEEAPAFDIPVLVLRNETERKEALDAGTVVLVGTDEENIFNETISLLEDKERYEKIAKARNPYGDGNASRRIVDVISD